MARRLLRWFGVAVHALLRKADVRPEERAAVAGSFTVLLLVVAGHTVLEAARDALLLSELPPSALSVVYLVVAGLSFPAAWASARLGARVGAWRALAASLFVAASATVVLFAVPATGASAMVLYVFTALVGAIVIPQFWALAGRLFTVAQGRRLLGPIGTAGLLGGLVGSGAAATALLVVPVKVLLLVAVALFVLAAFVVGAIPHESAAAAPRSEPRRALRAGSPFREEPFLGRIALLVAFSAAALLAVDYLFKWTVAHTVPTEGLGPFFARYYVLLNGLSLTVQIFGGAALVRRMGVAAAVAVTPGLILIGGAGVLVAHGALFAVLAMKGLDGSLRHSIHRLTTELLYLPLPRAVRERAKPIIDGTVARTAQAVTAAGLLGLTAAGMLSPTLLATIVVGLALLWFAVAATIRGPYLAGLRRTLSAGSLDEGDVDLDLDLATAEVLVERLASPDAAEVVAAMRVLARRRRERLIPALVLYHRNEQVLSEALSILAASARSDWIPLAQPLLTDEREAVRMAAVRALAQRGRVDLIVGLVDDASPRLAGYAAVHVATQAAPEDIEGHHAVATWLAPPGEEGNAARLGMLAAIADSPPSTSLAELLLRLAQDERLSRSPDSDELVGRAATAQRDPRLIPELLVRLPHGTSREVVRAALVGLGEPAQEAVWDALRDPSRPRKLRMHLPQTLAHFGTQLAADRLLEQIEVERHGMVRYKAIRGLGRLVADHDVYAERRRVERHAYRNLVEHMRLLGLRVAMGPPSCAETVIDARCAAATGKLLVGLLNDKLRQSLERTFRLLKIAHPREDIRRVHFATLSRDERARANGGEFLDTLLTRRDQQPLRELLRITIDDLDPAERLQRAVAHLPEPPPRTRDEALLRLLEDSDETLATLAASHAESIGSEALRAAKQRLCTLRPVVEQGAARLTEPMHA